MLTPRANYLRNARFGHPQFIPCRVVVSEASLAQCGPELEKVLARHPGLFPGFVPGRADYRSFKFSPEKTVGLLTDPWGCTWRCAVNGLVGTVVGHPLADFSALETLRPPPLLPQCAQRITSDWAAERRRIRAARRRGQPTSGGPPHGFFFMRLTYLRGFENLLCDLADRPPELRRLIEIVKGHNADLVERWLGLDVDVLGFGEDLGTQSAAMISPAMFAEHVTPVYRELMAPVRAAGKLVQLHTDGYVMDLVDEFAAAGVDILNPQDLVNGIDALAAEVKGRFCIQLDVDRQSVVPFGTRADIGALIEEEVRKLGDPAGGLELLAGIYPPTPPANVDALCEAFERFRTFWW